MFLSIFYFLLLLRSLIYFPLKILLLHISVLSFNQNSLLFLLLFIHLFYIYIFFAIFYKHSSIITLQFILLIAFFLFLNHIVSFNLFALPCFPSHCGYSHLTPAFTRVLFPFLLSMSLQSPAVSSSVQRCPGFQPATHSSQTHKFYAA